MKNLLSIFSATRRVSSTESFTGRYETSVKRPLTIFASVVGVTMGSAPLHAADQTWDGDTDGAWSTGSNWVGDPASVDVPGTGNTATFSGASGNITINLGGAISLSVLAFDNAASVAAYTIGVDALGTDTLTIDDGGSITMSSAVDQDQLINANVVLGPDSAASTYEISNASTTNTLTVAGSITGGNGGTAGDKFLTVSGDGNAILGGIISDDGSDLGIIKAGAGTLTLSAINAYGGITQLRDGTTIITNSEAIQGEIQFEDGDPILELGADSLDLSEQLFVRNSGTEKTVRLDLDGSTTATLSGRIINRETTASHFIIDVGEDDTLIVGGQVTSLSSTSGQSGITKNGLGTLNLNNVTNEYRGLTTINAGTLQISANGTLGDATSGFGTVVNDGGSLTLTGDFDYTATEELTLAGTGADGNGALQSLSGNNSFAGAISLSDDATIQTSGDLTLTGTISGSDILTKTGAGTLTLAGDSSYTGDTNLFNGKVIVMHDKAFGESNQVDILNAAPDIVEVELGIDGLTIANPFFVRNNGGRKIIRLDLSGSNTATLTGRIQIHENDTGDFRVDVGESDTLTFAGDNFSTFGGSRGFTKDGSGTLILSGTNTYNGETIVSAGTLLINGNSVIGGSRTPTLTVSSGATLGGSGKTNEVTTVNSGGFLTAGTNGTTGTLTFDGGLTMTSGSTWLLDLVHGGAVDFIDSTLDGGLDLGNATLNIQTSGAFVADQQYQIAQYSGSLSGRFAGLANNGDQIGQFTIDYGSITPGVITLTAVPEPTTFLLLLPLLVAGIWMHHYRKQNELEAIEAS